MGDIRLTVVGETSDQDPSDTPSFPDFWLLYPRRVAKKDAERAWIKLTAAQQMQAICAIADWRRVWADKDVDYLPHAATWLNGWRWEDELPASFTQSSAAHRPAALPDAPARAGIPEHVKAMIAKLRGK